MTSWCCRTRYEAFYDRDRHGVVGDNTYSYSFSLQAGSPADVADSEGVYFDSDIQSDIPIALRAARHVTAVSNMKTELSEYLTAQLKEGKLHMIGHYHQERNGGWYEVDLFSSCLNGKHVLRSRFVKEGG